MCESIKFLHEELGMRNIFFNRVMEDHVLDTAEELWELIQQFEKSIKYIAEHHAGLYCDTFGYVFTQSRSKKRIVEKDP
jgi:hypothetical protein